MESEQTSANASPTQDGSETAKNQGRHLSKILDEALEESNFVAPDAKQSYKHPMILDLFLALFLLVAVGGFTVGLVRIYIVHAADQSITQGNYKAAIAILKGAPFHGLFNSPGEDASDLLNKALYLDAMDKLDKDPQDESALHELQLIKQGSRYYSTSQELLKERLNPAPDTAAPPETQSPATQQPQTGDAPVNSQSGRQAQPAGAEASGQQAQQETSPANK